jgi:4-amino-4-deoxy-L-arabinose transferase-like glycosyltransferase
MPALLQASALLLGVPCALLVLAATAYVLGRLLTGELDRAVERWAVPTALGLAALSHLGLLLGFAHLLRPLPVLLLAAAIHLLGIRVWRELAGEAGRALRRVRGRTLVLVAAALLPFCVLSLYPPTAFDATLYHLPYAKGFVASGGVPFLRDLRFPVFPQANEMLFALVMLFAPDVAAHGVQWLMTMLTAALVWAWARDAFSASSATAATAAGWLAAAVFLGNPIVAYLAGTAYLEAGLTLFITAAFYAARRWRGSGERRWLVLAAAFAATAADTKYLGLFAVGVIGLTVLFGRWPVRDRWRSVLLFSAVAALLLAPWYGRIYAWTGNPFFPFFPRAFGAGAWAPIRFHSFLAPPARPDGTPIGREGVLGARLVDLVRLPYDLVFERVKYNGQPPISPFYLAALPLALLASWRDSRQRRLLAVAGAYAFACLALPADARYLAPALPLVSLAAAGALLPLLGRFHLPESRRRLAIAALCAICFLPGWLYAGFAIHRQGPLPLTAGQREAYLARWQPCYPAISYLNRTFGSGYAVWGLHAENMAFYARGRFMGDWIGLARFDRVLAGLRGPEDLHGRLRRLGAGYLLLPRQTASGTVVALPFPEDAAFRQWFEPAYADPHASVYRLRGES